MGNFEIKLGSVAITKELIVAKIDDDALLGMDVLHDESGGADILISEGIIRIRGESLPCEHHRTRRVRAAEDLKVPGFSEAIIKVCIDRRQVENDKFDLIVEPCDEFMSKSGIVVASTLVNIQRKVAVSVRVQVPVKWTFIQELW